MGNHWVTSVGGPNVHPSKAFLADGTPGHAAQRWATAILDEADVAAAWPLTDEPHRLALVQTWLIDTCGTTPEHVGMRAAGLDEAIAGEVDHEDFPEFAEWLIERLLSAFAATLPRWGIVPIAEAPTPDVEFIRLAQADDVDKALTGTSVIAQTLTMRLVGNRWLVAGIGRSLPVPGWPPTEQHLPTEHTSSP